MAPSNGIRISAPCARELRRWENGQAEKQIRHAREREREQQIKTYGRVIGIPIRPRK
jgi:hypothetical protein